MSPEPNPIKIYDPSATTNNENKVNSAAELVNTPANINSENGEPQISDVTNKPPMAQILQNTLLKPPATMHPRERRNISPSCTHLQDAFPDPMSPSSSSSTSQATSTNDATFEPTIEMMVNDFDDEQTLNEEEALASMESQNADEEINTLKEEGEMPLEELLAKYKALPPMPPVTFIEPPRKKSKKSSSHKKKHKSKSKQAERVVQHTTTNENMEENFPANLSGHDTKSTTAKTKENVIAIDSGRNESISPEETKACEDDEEISDSPVSSSKPLSPLVAEERKDIADELVAGEGGVRSGIVHTEVVKVRRSHLLDLYPEGTFDNVVVVKDMIAGNGKDIPLKTIYGDEDDEDEDEEIEEEEDEDYKKKVMIGISYQATIPQGLSQYGDILPYENEDKLIWEPSQVSEREVEEYLIKIRDIKSNQQQGEDEAAMETNVDSNAKENRRVKNKDNLENSASLSNGEKLQNQATAATDLDNQSVVKDNEQALHLLVQCGYDFKEALRRKRLNALPLNDCMSLWSEEECHKFEEGIQKFGKDFLKIRQNQVRTRTMRELVQFYYLWKKSERRDHNFANADTVDHMDIYLNEDNEYGSNPASVTTPVGSPVGTTSGCSSSSARRNSNAAQKNISIMTTTNTINNSSATANLSLDKNCSNNVPSTQHHQHQHQQRRRASNSCPNNVSMTTNDFNVENSANVLSK